MTDETLFVVRQEAVYILAVFSNEESAKEYAKRAAVSADLEESLFAVFPVPFNPPPF